MGIRKFPFKENGWWVVYDYGIVTQNLKLIKFQKLSGKLLLILAFLFLALFISPFTKPATHAEVFVEHPLDKLKLNPVDKKFTLMIPKLNINVMVSENVDSQNRDAFELYLTKGVAQAKGTALPGERGGVYIFGHSSDYFWLNNSYASVFSNLSDLKPGDKIYLAYKSNLYDYSVAKQDIVNPDRISYLYPDNNVKKLLLQTCWPVGTDWQRLIITADLDNVTAI